MQSYQENIYVTDETNRGSYMNSYWGAQDHQSLDSGIHSGRQPIISQYEDNPVWGHEDPFFAQSQGYTQNEIDDINEQYHASRAMRIRAAMFPEAVEREGATGGGQYDRPAYDVGQSSNIERLSQPAQLLKTAIVNLINYQDDAELATNAIPELIKLLNDDDPAVVARASKMVHDLSKKDASLRALMNNPQMLNALVRVMESSNDPQVTKHIAAAMYHLSQHPQGLLAIFRSGGIAALVRLLSSPIDTVVFYAITTLHNLLLHQDGAKQAVRTAGGLPKMVALLQKNIPKFLAIVTDCLHLLAFQHQESRMIILSCGGPGELVRIMRSYQYEKLLWTTSRVLKVLSVCPNNKAAIVETGGLQALAHHVRGPSERVALNCLLSIRNLSDAATREENVEGLIQALIARLNEEDFQIVACCAGILSNLTCNNQRNKTTVCRDGGIEALLRAITNCAAKEEITEPAVCALRHVTSRHPDAEMAQNAVRLHGGLPILMGLLSTGAQWPLIKAVIGLLRNLATCPANQQPLRDLSAISLLAQILQRVYGDLQQGGENGIYEPGGVGMIEVAEVSTSAFHSLARDPINRSAIKQQNLIPVFVALLYYNENIQREAAGALAELALDKDAAVAIEQEGATAPLTEALHSKNESVATYAAAVLYRMGQDKPPDYRKRLSLELSSSLYRDETMPWAHEGMGDLNAMPADEAFPDHNGILYQHQAYENQAWNGHPYDAPPETPGQSTYYGTMGSVATSTTTVPHGLPPNQHGVQPPGAMAWYDTDL